jgi:hypothetical protein
MTVLDSTKNTQFTVTINTTIAAASASAKALVKVVF